MLAYQPTTADSSCQDPFRWSHAEIFTSLDKFSDPDQPDPLSGREFAEQHGIPHATFNYWLRHYSPVDADPVDSFFCSGPGELVLRRIVCSAILVFNQRGAEEGWRRSKVTIIGKATSPENLIVCATIRIDRCTRLPAYFSHEAIF